MPEKSCVSWVTKPIALAQLVEVDRGRSAMPL